MNKFLGLQALHACQFTESQIAYCMHKDQISTPQSVVILLLVSMHLNMLD